MGMSTARKIPQTKRAEHRQVLAGRSTAERISARAGICLKDCGITLKTKARYQTALRVLMPIIVGIASLEELDSVCEDWVEFQWTKGATLGSIGDALCGLQFYWPEVKGKLRGTWRLYKNWRRLEIPTRAPPISALIVQAFVGYLMSREFYTSAFLIALGFHAYLRTGELLNLQFRDLQLGSTTGICTVRGGKSGLRNNIDEAIALYDRSVLELGRIVFILPHHQRGTSKVWPFSASSFRKMFAECVKTFSLENLELKPYSLRRGGATHDYIQQGVLESILLRGRWHSLAVARLYLEDGLAQLPNLRLPPPTHRHLHKFASPFSTMF